MKILKLKKYASIYSIGMGLSMIGMWIMFYLADSIPELVTKPIELGMHLLAEMITALLLIIGGIGLLGKKDWGLQVYFISMGMLLYTVIMSPGYFLQQGEYGFGIMFGFFTTSAVGFTLAMVLQERTLR